MLFLPIHNKVAFGINIWFRYLYPFISILMTRPLDWTLCTSCRYSSYHLKSQLCPPSLCTPKAASICHLIYIPKTTISPISDSLWGRSSNHSAGDASHGPLSQFVTGVPWHLVCCRVLTSALCQATLSLIICSEASQVASTLNNSQLWIRRWSTARRLFQ